MKIESYTKRLCSHIQGVLQVVATDRAALEVDEHVQLYPQIIDIEKITALRVEASLWRAAR